MLQLIINDERIKAVLPLEHMADAYPLETLSVIAADATQLLAQPVDVVINGNTATLEVKKEG